MRAAGRRYLLGMATALALVAVATIGGAGSAEADGRQAVGPFWIDRTEVTIAAFARFAEATGTVTAAEKVGGGYEYDGGWQRRPGWTFRRPYGKPPESAKEPAVHVTWGEASAYCRWAGGRLPTAAEWRRAAYTEGRAKPPAPFVAGRTYPYPTGDTPDGANTRGDDPWPRHAPVGTTKRGVNGLWDMGANVWEWAADRRGDAALTMGGSWWYGPHMTRSDSAQYKPADFYAVYVGFRCTYDRAG